MGNDKFTQKAEIALNNSLEIAERMGSLYIGTEHILFSLLETSGSIAEKILNESGVTKSNYLKALQCEEVNVKRTKLTVKNMTPRARESKSKAQIKDRTRGPPSKGGVFCRFDRMESI